MGIRFSHVLAIGVAGGLAYYMASGQVVIGGQPKVAPPSIVERKADGEADLFAVAVETSEAQARSAILDVRGRTEADAKVEVRAETGGIVEERSFEKGQRVAEGVLLCTLERGSREARLLQAKAQLTQAETDLQANSTLSEKGYAAKNQLPALQAAVDAATAAVKEAEIELERTEVRAPVSGVIQDPLAEEGDLLAAGGTCATIIDADPMKIIGQVGEQEVGALELGMEAGVRLVTGQETTGTLVYIAPSADPQTRTFRAEVAVPNTDGAIRDGVTATAQIALPSTPAHRVASSVLTLNDDGRVGVRTVDDESVARFVPIEVLGTATDGVWIAGLPDTARIITVGHDYVVDGQPVKAVEQIDELAKTSR